jgi:hypothetical protein
VAKKKQKKKAGINNANKNIPVVKTPSANKYNKALGLSYMYFCVLACPNLLDKDTEICINSGTRNIIIGRLCLKTLKHFVKKRERTVTGIRNY